MNNIKSDVLKQISSWADGMNLDRIKARKAPASLEIEAEGHGEVPGLEDNSTPEGMATEAEEKARGVGGEENELSLEDLLALDK